MLKTTILALGRFDRADEAAAAEAEPKEAAAAVAAAAAGAGGAAGAGVTTKVNLMSPWWVFKASKCKQ